MRIDDYSLSGGLKHPRTNYVVNRNKPAGPQQVTHMMDKVQVQKMSWMYQLIGDGDMLERECKKALDDDRPSNKLSIAFQV